MPFSIDLDGVDIKHLFEVDLGMPENTVARLSEEGIKRTSDLVVFTSVNVKTIIGNLRYPGERATNRGQYVPTSPVKYGAK